MTVVTSAARACSARAGTGWSTPRWCGPVMSTRIRSARRPTAMTPDCPILPSTADPLVAMASACSSVRALSAASKSRCSSSVARIVSSGVEMLKGAKSLPSTMGTPAVNSRSTEPARTVPKPSIALPTGLWFALTRALPKAAMSSSFSQPACMTMHRSLNRPAFCKRAVWVRWKNSRCALVLPSLMWLWTWVGISRSFASAAMPASSSPTSAWRTSRPAGSCHWSVKLGPMAARMPTSTLLVRARRFRSFRHRRRR